MCGGGFGASLRPDDDEKEDEADADADADGVELLRPIASAAAICLGGFDFGGDCWYRGVRSCSRADPTDGIVGRGV